MSREIETKAAKVDRLAQKYQAALEEIKNCAALVKEAQARLKIAMSKEYSIRIDYNQALAEYQMAEVNSKGAKNEH